MIDYEKIAAIMCWQKYEGETFAEMFTRKGKNIGTLPDAEIIDIVYCGGLQKWAETLNVSSQDNLYHAVLQAIRKTISEPVFNNRSTLNEYPPLANFFYYCQKLDRNGKSAIEAEAIADIAWNGVICRRNLSVNVAKYFSKKPDKAIFDNAKNRIAEIWGFTDKEIDAIRYFVCQTRHEKHNPSLNKNIYIWGNAKGTGKTTIARAIVTIVNGDTFDNFGKYESTFNTEMAYNDHDLPLAALYNAVLLDESMPKDTRKSYGSIKRVLTSSSFNYNPKFRQIINIKCRRFYFCTSNEDIADFVQDATERRFFAINIERKPVQLSFDEIYKIWFDFCTNAEPEENWHDWYNSFQYVNGLAAKDMQEVKDEIVLNFDSIFTPGFGSYLTVKKIAGYIFKNEPSTDQKRAVSSAMKEMFSDCRLSSNKALYSIQLCRERFNERFYIDDEKREKLPF